MRILSFGYVKTGYTFDLFDTLDATEVMETDEMQNILAEHATVTDAVIINFHAGANDDEILRLYRYLRNYFIKNYKYDVPIIIHSAHDHKLQKFTCNYTNNLTGEVVDNDTQCYQTDAGNYLKYMVHMTYTFEEEEVSYESGEEIKKFKGSKLVARTDDYVNHYDDNKLVNIIDGTDYGFAARFNKTPDTFDTEHGR